MSAMLLPQTECAFLLSVCSVVTIALRVQLPTLTYAASKFILFACQKWAWEPYRILPSLLGSIFYAQMSPWYIEDSIQWRNEDRPVRRGGKEVTGDIRCPRITAALSQRSGVMGWHMALQNSSVEALPNVLKRLGRKSLQVTDDNDDWLLVFF